MRPRPDQTDAINQFVGATHRYGRAMPDMDEGETSLFEDVVHELIALGFFPRAVEAPPDLWQRWAEGASYTVAQVKSFALLLLRQGRKWLRWTDFRCDSFIKLEGYPKAKVPRCINAYNDKIKALVGPWIRLFDETLFSMRYFVKHVDVRMRPQLLHETFGERPVMMTDFTSFEAHHRGPYARVVLRVMRHMIPCAPRDFWKALQWMILGENASRFSGVDVVCEERLMSGAAYTSSANGLLNMLLCLYIVCRSRGLTDPRELARAMRDTPALFEGDDGITAASSVDEQLIVRLGLLLKFEMHAHYGDGSFCGVVTMPGATLQLTDPLKVLAEFPVLDPKYLNARPALVLSLLRAKALSYLYAYPECPIVSALCRYHLRISAGHDVRQIARHLTWFEREILKKALAAEVWRDGAVPVSDAARRIVEERYAITQLQQRRAEAYLDAKQDVGPLFIDVDFPLSWCEYARCYAVDVGGVPPEYDRAAFAKPEPVSQSDNWEISSRAKRFKTRAWAVPGLEDWVVSEASDLLALS